MLKRVALSVAAAARLRDLRRATLYEEISCGEVAKYQKSQVSWPEVSSNPEPLEKLWGMGGSDMIDAFINNEILRPERCASGLHLVSLLTPRSQRARTSAADLSFSTASCFKRWLLKESSHALPEALASDADDADDAHDEANGASDSACNNSSKPS